jgi:hypothetical protein
MNKSEILGTGITAIAIALLIGGTIAVVPAVAQDNGDSQSSVMEDNDEVTQSYEVTVNQNAEMAKPPADASSAEPSGDSIEQNADITTENTVEDNDEFNNQQTFRKEAPRDRD